MFGSVFKNEIKPKVNHEDAKGKKTPPKKMQWGKNGEKDTAMQETEKQFPQKANKSEAKQPSVADRGTISHALGLY